MATSTAFTLTTIFVSRMVDYQQNSQKPLCVKHDMLYLAINGISIV